MEGRLPPATSGRNGGRRRSRGIGQRPGAFDPLAVARGMYRVPMIVAPLHIQSGNCYTAHWSLVQRHRNPKLVGGHILV